MAFHVEEFSLTTESLPQLFPKPAHLGLRTACILKSHDTYFPDVHEDQNFFKFLPINPVYVERGNRDVAAFEVIGRRPVRANDLDASLLEIVIELKTPKPVGSGEKS